MSAEDKPSPAYQFQPQRPGERRQLTVMFCDLLGSTEMSTLLDPEEMSEVLQVYRAHVTAAIGKFNGTIAQYLGDGFLAYFGYPQANENDAECAVRAGIEIVRQWPDLVNSRSEFKARIGIATGLVVIGEAFETPSKRELLAIGETPNLAARLQAIAPANGILIAESTRRLVGSLFEFAAPISVNVKGLASPVTAYEVIGASVIESRFEALRSEATPFVGRQEEIALLRARWEQACSGEGCVVLLSGEAGIGKSRILDRVRKEFETKPGHCLRFFCSPLHTQTAMYPFQTHLRRVAGLKDEDADGDKLAKLTCLLETILNEPRAAAEDIADFLGITAPSQRHAALTVQQRKETAIKIYLDYPAVLSRREPLLTIMDDAHWIDPTSIELIDRLVAGIATQRMLMIVSARPEYQPVWMTHPSVTLLSLSRLGWREGAAIISGAAGGKALPPQLTEQILERSDGVPLFLEELTKTLLDSGWLEEAGDEYKLRGVAREVALPSTLQDSLISRLDRLGPVKGLAEVGSAIGREFSHDLLQAVTGLSDADLEDGLSRLIASGLVYRRGAAPDAVYYFKHALIQDAAYGTVLKTRRQQLHAKIAETIFAKFPSVAASQPELIAHHLTAAEDFPHAIDHWLIAGKAQIRASADLEAISHLTRGISLLDRLPDLHARQRAELKLQSALIGPLVAVKGASSTDVAECCERGLALSRISGVSPFPFVWGQFIHKLTIGKLREAAETAWQFIEIAEAANFASGSVVGQRMLGLALLSLGKLREARRAFEIALAGYRPERDDAMTDVFGHNVQVNSQTLLSLTLFLLGEREASRRLGAECLAMADRLKHPHSTAIAIHYQLHVHYLAEEIEELRAPTYRLVDIATEFGLKHFSAIGHVFLGYGLFHDGQTEAGIRHIESALEAYERLNIRFGDAVFRSMLARAKCGAGQFDEAMAHCARAKAVMEECEEFWIAPEILSIEAEIIMRSTPLRAEHARSMMDMAIERARGIESYGLEARCRRARERLFAKGVELA